MAAMRLVTNYMLELCARTRTCSLSKRGVIGMTLAIVRLLQSNEARRMRNDKFRKVMLVVEKKTVKEFKEGSPNRVHIGGGPGG